MDAKTRRQLRALAGDPAEFISRLRIVDQRGQERTMSNPFGEQILALNDFLSPAETVIHYKPRQIGNTTVGTAYNFGYLYFWKDSALLQVTADSFKTLCGPLKQA